MIQTEVCIIGAGPAGAATSLTLSKMKISHVILDAAIFPRDKVCGDALDTMVMRVLNSIEPGFVKKEIIHDSNFSKSNSFLIHVNENRKAMIQATSNNPFPDLPFLCFCKRSYFDHFLLTHLNKQYAHFLPGTKVKKILHEKSEKIIYTKQNGKEIQIKAKMIVGADGDHSVVLRSLGGRKIDRVHYAGALRQYWKGISDLKPDVLELYLPKSIPLGYLWIFPLPNGEANVGLGSQSAIITKNKIDLKKVMTDLIQNDPVLKYRFENAIPLESMQGHGLPYASLQRKISGDGWLLTGDAASLVCPTTGEGIGPAMLSGYIAAHFVQRAVQKNDFSAGTFTHYDREVYKRLKESIRTYQFLLNTSPALYRFFLNNVISNSYIRKKIITYFNRKIELAYTEKIPVNLD